MSQVPDALCLNVSRAFKCFDRPLLRELSKTVTVAQWEYGQSPDEPCSLETPLVLLHDYLKQSDRPIHLIGHGLSGALGLLYARRHPERVRSLTLLSVGAFPTIDWQAHYYVQRQFLKCSQAFVLTQVVTNLFGTQCKATTQRLVSVLEKDLETSPSSQSLCRQTSLPPGGAPVPLMVGRGEYDVVVDPNALEQWLPWLKEGDVQWECPDSRHFFHYSHPLAVAERVLDFWRSLPPVRPVTARPTALQMLSSLGGDFQ
ncbi:MAG: alpha/beta hydrolase [Synechococcales bacterium]|nr:alpha/beta hydrolase [Synechococcales bacterium]